MGIEIRHGYRMTGRRNDCSTPNAYSPPLRRDRFYSSISGSPLSSTCLRKLSRFIPHSQHPLAPPPPPPVLSMLWFESPTRHSAVYLRPEIPEIFRPIVITTLCSLLAVFTRSDYIGFALLIRPPIIYHRISKRV